MKNGVQLITYVDRLGQSDLAGLRALLRGQFPNVFAGVHLLPFFNSIHGADAGFDPVDHLAVDPTLGSWGDVLALSQDLPVMADVIVNHVSSSSAQFQDFLAHGEASAHARLFLSLDRVFPQGATEQDLLAIYRPRPGLPFTAVNAADNKRPGGNVRNRSGFGRAGDQSAILGAGRGLRLPDETGDSHDYSPRSGNS